MIPLRLKLALPAALVPALAFAQASPFGVGPRPPAAAPPVSGVAAWLLAQQAAFHRELTAAIGAVAGDPLALFTLVGLAFAYGVIHAIGPGHGKAVIASYLVANETAMRRGIALSFGAAAVQALVALGVVAIVAGLMRGNAAAIERTTLMVEQAGFALIAAMGFWLAFRKARALWLPLGASAECGPNCGHDHGLDPRLLARASFRDLALTAIGAGIRPCTGAIILLVFALAKGLFLAGALSVAAMAIGTALGTSLFAVLAVRMKRVALNLISGRGNGLRRLATVLELVAGLALAALGIALFTGATIAGA